VSLAVELDDLDNASASDIIKAINKALAGLPDMIQKTVLAAIAPVSKQVETTQQTSQQAIINDFSEKHPLFREAMADREKHEQLLSDTDSFLKSGNTLNQAWTKAMKANGIDSETKFLKAQEPHLKEPKEEKIRTTSIPTSEQLSTPEDLDLQRKTPDNKRKAIEKNLESALAELTPEERAEFER
jgi:hypothetical protein